jgi:DUF1365 family protein
MKVAMHSCLYRGHVEHHRLAPTAHRFRYAVFWLYLDLGELERVVHDVRLLSTRRFAATSFCRADHLGPPTTPLVDAVRAHIEATTGTQLNGPVRLLTQLRQFGLYFSPLNLYFCFEYGPGALEAVVAEVSNTPWNETHHYTLWEGNRLSVPGYHFSHTKDFHVSPFMDMRSEYDWSIESPGDELHVSMSCRDPQERFFRVQMNLQREELNDKQLARLLLRFPVTAAQTLGAIYLQAWKLWKKKCRFYPHPSKARPATHSVA